MEGVPPSGSDSRPSDEAASCTASSPEASIPNADDWQYALGEVPSVDLGQPIYALGRYGDIFGPLPFEMFARDAWTGHMLHASCDLVAWAACDVEWELLFPCQPRDASVYGKRATAESASSERTGA